MPKYHPSQLKEMARTVANASDDVQFQFIMLLAIYTGLNANEVKHRIQEMIDA